MGDGGMSRWAEMFAALSHARDTVDPLRHNDEPASTPSHTVESVTALEPARASRSPRKREAERSCQSVAWRAVNVAQGEIPSAWAEGLARLDRNRPPGDVPPSRWRRFVDDAKLFRDSRFCTAAAAFGWTAHDLFDCDPDRPFTSVDQDGRWCLLGGTRRVVLTTEPAIIGSNTVTYQGWTRKQ